MIKKEKNKLSLIKGIDLIVFMIGVIAVIELFQFMFFGSIFSWLVMLERFPHLEHHIILVFKIISNSLIILSLALIYYVIRMIFDLFKKKKYG